MNLARATMQPTATPSFRTPSRLALIRDVAVIGVCVALIVGFLLQIWGAPPPSQMRSAASPAAALLAA